jgi:hypothetical protein
VALQDGQPRRRQHHLARPLRPGTLSVWRLLLAPHWGETGGTPVGKYG